VKCAIAQIELLGQDTIRLTLQRRMTWKACVSCLAKYASADVLSISGQHAYVILPTVSGLPTEVRARHADVMHSH
jgi:hypothetical protein